MAVTDWMHILGHAHCWSVPSIAWKAHSFCARSDVITSIQLGEKSEACRGDGVQLRSQSKHEDTEAWVGLAEKQGPFHLTLLTPSASQGAGARTWRLNVTAPSFAFLSACLKTGMVLLS